MDSKHHTELRYEYRTFGHQLQLIHEKLKEFSEEVPQEYRLRESEEVYFLHKNHLDVNCKIRDNNLDIKILARTVENFELWKPDLRISFPLQNEKVTKILSDYFKTPPKTTNKNLYDVNSFIELMKKQKGFTVVPVRKVRRSYLVNQTVCEFAEVNISGIQWQTVCIESENIEKVKNVTQRLNLLQFENINYPQAISKLIDL